MFPEVMLHGGCDVPQGHVSSWLSQPGLLLQKLLLQGPLPDTSNDTHVPPVTRYGSIFPISLHAFGLSVTP